MNGPQLENTGASQGRSKRLAPLCIACSVINSKLSPAADADPSWEDIPELTSPAEVTGYADLIATNERHIAVSNDIRAHYDQLGSKVPCSLHGRHRHKTGIVVKALCGKTLCMGFVCGEKSIVGFDVLKQEPSVPTFVRQQPGPRILSKPSRASLA